jgi:transposase-like protein
MKGAEDAMPHGGTRRRTKFTPQNIRRITDLVQEGKTREQIAQEIGVTPGTLAVACSKLKVSLRRPRARGAVRNYSPPRTIGVMSGVPLKRRQKQSAGLAIQMTFKGATRIMELPVPSDMIAQLALQAEFRGMHLAELIAELLISSIRRRGISPRANASSGSQGHGGGHAKRQSAAEHPGLPEQAA